MVVCTKNQAKALEQILTQIVQEIPFENLIVVYGNSTDNTREIASKYTDKVFWDGDKGLGAARNMGIQKATSEIVTMIDSDVTLDKGWYNQLIGHFQNPDVAAVMGTCVYGYGCKPLETYWEYQRCNETINYGCQNTMFRRELVLKVGNFNKAIKGAGEDYDLFQKVLSAGFKWLWIRDASAYHPLTLMEYIKHVRWWARGQPFIIEAANWAAKTSLVRVYARQVLYMIESFFKGVKLSVKVHPIFLLYYPLLRIMSGLELLNGLKKQGLCSSREL